MKNLILLSAVSLLLVNCTGMKASGPQSMSVADFVSSTSVPVGTKVVIDDMVFVAKPAKGVSPGHMVAQSLSGLGASGGVAWPGGILPVQFDSKVGATQRTKFFAACAKWSAVANVTCKPYTNEDNFAKVTTEDGKNYSGIGYHGASALGTQINITTNGWTDERLIIHELGHMFGLLHEHQRPDRDSYIQVLAQNISKGNEGQLDKITYWTLDTSRPYDMRSMMHYSSTSFAVAGTKTIVPLAQYAGTPVGIYENPGLTAGDAAGMSAIYGAPQAPATQVAGSGSTQSGGTQVGGSQSNGTQTGGAQSGGTQTGGTQGGTGTQAGTQTGSGGTQAGSGTASSGGTQTGSTQSGGTSVQPPPNPAQYDLTISQAYTEYLPGCLTNERLAYWRNYFTTGGSPSAFLSTVKVASTPETLVSCQTWTPGSPGLLNAIKLLYDHYLPYCGTEGRVNYWFNWFNSPVAKPIDFVKTLIANATPAILAQCKTEAGL